MFLPDGRHFVFYRTGQERGGIYLGSLDRPLDQQESQPLVTLRVPTSLAYTPAFRDGVGGILYMDEDKLMGLPFDHDRLTAAGEPVMITDGVGKGGAGYGFFSVSAAGVLAYRRGNDRRALTWFDRAGAVLGTAGEGQNEVSLSSDGLWAAVASARAIVLLDLRRGLRTRLTERPGRNGVWSPDGVRRLLLQY